MKRLSAVFSGFFLTPVFFIALGGLSVMMLMGYFFPSILAFAFVSAWVLPALVLADTLILFGSDRFSASRELSQRFSNGDENPVHISLTSLYGVPVRVRILDEIPDIFQRRDLRFNVHLHSGETKTITYHVRPVKRGSYVFGALNVFAASPLYLVRRKYVFDADAAVAVYPSYLQMHKYEMMAFSNRMQDYGFRKQRRAGAHTEFEHIREYVTGDDFRHINWKASARRTKPMVNQYQEERAQQVYCIIDKGRMMRSPFGGLSLLDYSINATLVLSRIVLRKYDKAGVITFSEDRVQMLAADRDTKQMQEINELLYNQKTRYLEPDYDLLYNNISRKISHRSLLILFTNYESLVSLRRNIRQLKALSAKHLLLVVFFKNTEMDKAAAVPAKHMEQLHIQTVARQFAYEKEQIVHELRRYGIYSVLTAPEDLNTNTINAYLEFKARGLI